MQTNKSVVLVHIQQKHFILSHSVVHGQWKVVSSSLFYMASPLTAFLWSEADQEPVSTLYFLCCPFLCAIS